MEHVKEGNLSEMSVLFERYHLKLYNFFYRLTGKREISQDLTQNLFYRLIKYRNSYRKDCSVKTWIYRIARNIHLDYRKEEKKTAELFTNDENYFRDAVDDNEGFYEDDYLRLDEAFSALSTDQKEIIVLSRYQGLKYEEISNIKNQSVPAIKVAVYRAIRRLRKVYFKQL